MMGLQSVSTFAVQKPEGSRRIEFYIVAKNKSRLTEVDLRQQKDKFYQFFVDNKLYSEEVYLSLSFQGEKANLRFEAPESIVKKFEESFKDEFSLQDTPYTRKSVIPKQAKKKVMEDGNRILADYANDILKTPYGFDLQERSAFYEAQMKIWELKAYDVGNGETSKPSVILWEDNLDSSFRREFRVLNEVAKEIFAPNVIPYEERLDNHLAHLQPYDGASVADFEKLKRPGLENVMTQAQEAVVHFNSQSPEMRVLNGRIQFVENEFFRTFTRFDGLDTYNRQTYEVLASAMHLKLDELDREFGSFEVGEVLSRYLVLCRALYKSNDFGPKTLKLFERLSRYPALSPYVQLMLKATVAKAQSGKSMSPTPEDIAAYQKMWAEMPMKPIRGSNTVSVPVQPFGQLFNPVGVVEMPVSEGVAHIESWFEKHGVPTVDWKKQAGVPLEFVRSRLEKKKVDHLNLSAEKSCASILKEILRKKL